MAYYPKIKIIVDNNPYNRKLETSWGFSCIVEAADKTILFDTGGDGNVLMNNMSNLGVNPHDTDIVFLSHLHGDHVGGIYNFFRRVQ